MPPKTTGTRVLSGEKGSPYGMGRPGSQVIGGERQRTRPNPMPGGWGGVSPSDGAGFPQRPSDGPRPKPPSGPPSTGGGAIAGGKDNKPPKPATPAPRIPRQPGAPHAPGHRGTTGVGPDGEEVPVGKPQEPRRSGNRGG